MWMENASLLQSISNILFTNCCWRLIESLGSGWGEKERKKASINSVPIPCRYLAKSTVCKLRFRNSAIPFQPSGNSLGFLFLLTLTHWPVFFGSIPENSWTGATQPRNKVKYHYSFQNEARIAFQFFHSLIHLLLITGLCAWLALLSLHHHHHHHQEVASCSFLISTTELPRLRDASLL